MPVAAVIMDPAEAAQLVRSGDTVVIGGLSSEPSSLVHAVCERGDELHDVTLIGGVLLDGYPFLAWPKEVFRFQTWFMPSTTTEVRVDPHRIEYLPLSWSQAYRYLQKRPIDLALVQVTPPTIDGRCSLGTSVSYTTAAVAAARTVVGAFNRNMPMTWGDSELDADRIGVLLPCDEELAEFPVRPPDDVDRQIAEHVACGIADGTVLQVGLGTLPAAVVSAVARLGRRDIQQFSMLTDEFLELMDGGASPRSGPAAVVGEIVGSRKLYERVDGDRSVLMADARTTHDLGQLLTRQRLVSLGSGLEVDLFGQANLEVLNGAQAGGVGGGFDYLAVSGLTETAESVIMLRAETSAGRSRIVPQLGSGPVSIPRTLVRRVVTEYGEARLDGLSARHRALALASVAAPRHRDRLLEQIDRHPEQFGG